MKYLFIVVMPKELKNWIRPELGISGIAQRNLYWDLSNHYGDSWHESDLNKAKEDIVKAVMKRHHIRRDNEIDVCIFRDDRIEKEIDTEAYRSFAQKIAEEQNIGDRKYRWEFQMYAFESSPLSFAFPVLAIWVPGEGSENAPSSKNWWQFWK